MFYWHIQQLDKEELLFKSHLAQTLKPSKNDWVLTIKQDLKEIGLNMNEEEIFKLSLDKFKAIVISKVNSCVKKQFMSKQGSKTENLKIEDHQTICFQGN